MNRNIVITLPKKLIDAILDGSKMVELRKVCPKIVCNRSRVYMIEKGTHQLRGYFTVDRIRPIFGWKVAWELWGDKIGVPRSYVIDYVGVGGTAYGWCIDRAVGYSCYRSAIAEFGIWKNPQSFIYTDRLI